MIENDDLEKFTSRRLAEYINTLHVSLRELERFTGVARTTIMRYLRGKTKISLYFLEQFLNFINIDIGVFYEPYTTQQRKLACLA